MATADVALGSSSATARGAAAARRAARRRLMVRRRSPAPDAKEVAPRFVPVAGRGGQPPGETLGLPDVRFEIRDVRDACGRGLR